MAELFCPKCKISLRKRGDKSECASCSFFFQDVGGVLVNGGDFSGTDKNYYDGIYDSEHGKKWLQGLNRASLAKRILEKISLSYRRERFFKRNIRGTNNLILDLACGAGRDYFKKFGTVIGVDLSYSPLQEAKRRYDMVIQSGCDALPFADNTFDYVVSSDFFGHVRAEDKNKIIKEILRVLKRGGKTLDVIETDSDNVWFRIAHTNSEYFNKYFVEQVGGHVGLEMPMDCARRWADSGFELIKAEKIWGSIWPVEYYKDFFDNEYKNISAKAQVAVKVSKFFSRVKVVNIIVNILLNPVNYIVELFTPLNHGNGLMIVCRKK